MLVHKFCMITQQSRVLGHVYMMTTTVHVVETETCQLSKHFKDACSFWFFQLSHLKLILWKTHLPGSVYSNKLACLFNFCILVKSSDLYNVHLFNFCPIISSNQFQNWIHVNANMPCFCVDCVTFYPVSKNHVTPQLRGLKTK